MSIRRATIADVPQMVDLSEKKRAHYETFQPLFWRKAKDSREQQLPFFAHQIENTHLAILVHEGAGQIDGFIIANLRGGQVCSVDDFALADKSGWTTIGKALLQAAGAEAKQQGIKTYEVVCGHLDRPKQEMLNKFGLAIDRYWYTAAIHPVEDHRADVLVRAATATDGARMAEIVGQPGRQYGEMGRANAIVLVCEQADKLLGYALAIVIPTPPVYAPGGPTCLVLEAVMEQPADWGLSGKALLQKIQTEALKQKAVQVVMICDQKDLVKQNALQALGATIASEWYVGEIQ